METTKMTRNTRSVAALALALQAVALPVAAEVVLYDNSARIFEWLPETGSGAPSNYFDPTHPPTQPEDQTQSGLRHTAYLPGTSTGIAVNSISGGGAGFEIAVDDSFTVHGSEGAQATVTPAKQFLPGEAIGPGAEWAAGADHFWITNVDGFVPLLGDPPLIGFRAETNGHYQYGWIELGLRKFEAPYFGLHYQPIRWVYETELNTPITVIPEPASLVLVLLLLVVAAFLRPVRRAIFQ
jgi:hypothetical protein